jgi:hypothetical protein
MELGEFGNKIEILVDNKKNRTDCAVDCEWPLAKLVEERGKGPSANLVFFGTFLRFISQKYVKKIFL